MNKDIDDIVRSCGIEVFATIKYDTDYVPFHTRNRACIPEDAKSILCCLFPYYSAILEENRNISYYACVDDYHNVAGDMLKTVCKRLTDIYKENKFISFVDNSPVDEVNVASKAGLGVVGSNSLLINEDYGSYVFIGCIITDMHIDAVEADAKRCIRCDICKKMCPSNAISDHGVDKQRCLSYVTQKKGELTQDEQWLMKTTGIVWGCDICQQVCPMNKDKKETYINYFKKNIQTNVNTSNVDILIKTRAFGYRGIKVMQRNLDICGY